MTDPNQPISYPLLIRFAKAGLMRFVGHLDWLALQQAMFLKAGFKIVVGEGPTRKLRMKSSPPTPVGVESRTELTYLALAEALYPREALRRLLAHCPDGVEVVACMDAGHLARKNPFVAIEATMYSVEFGDGIDSTKLAEIIPAFENIRDNSPPDDVDPDLVKKFWGRILEVDVKNGKIDLLVKQLEGDTFHAAQCAEFLESNLDLPHYPIFTKMDYYRLKPSKRRLFS